MTDKIDVVKTPQLIYDSVKTENDIGALSLEDLQDYALALDILYNQAREELEYMKSELAKLDKEMLAPLSERLERRNKV